MKKTLDMVLQEMKNYSDFQQKVWKACLLIPEGQTRSYSWIAQKIGSPKAARAVGSALAKNPFAPIVPCHRVLRKDGGMGGYSAQGGILRKQKMLNQEASKLKK